MLLAVGGALGAGCLVPAEHEVVVYTALDREFSQPIFDRFTRQTGIVVRAKFDTEATKTVGLAAAIRAERHRPRCDVFWNNEILNTLRLEQRGLLARYRSPAAESFPAAVRSADGTWCGFAARARVLLVNTDLVAKTERPASIQDLVARRWHHRVAVAKPLFGTTATHAACLFDYWGDRRARQFFLELRDNARVLAGNRQVAQAVGVGVVAFGLTDTDDAVIELDKGRPVTIVYPDQEDDGMGTLFIPNSLAILRGAPHPAAARQLVDYLLAPAVETRLAQGRSAQIPLNPHVQTRPRVQTPATVRAMQVDFAAAARQWDTVVRFLREVFARP